MFRVTTISSMLGLAIAAQPLAADLVVCDMARVATHIHLEETCIAPVVITRIDGERRAVPAESFLIEPGIHTLNGRVTLDTTQCETIQGDLQLGPSPGLEVNFEAGRTYHIAYDHRSADPLEWQLVIRQVEQPCSMYQACLPAD